MKRQIGLGQISVKVFFIHQNVHKNLDGFGYNTYSEHYFYHGFIFDFSCENGSQNNQNNADWQHNKMNCTKHNFSPFYYFLYMLSHNAGMWIFSFFNINVKLVEGNFNLFSSKTFFYKLKYCKADCPVITAVNPETVNHID